MKRWDSGRPPAGVHYFDPQPPVPATYTPDKWNVDKEPQTVITIPISTFIAAYAGTSIALPMLALAVYPPAVPWVCFVLILPLIAWLGTWDELNG